MELKVVNTKGKETAKAVNLAETIFGIEPNDHAIYLDVKQILARKRQGTSKSKERAEISGSTRKIKKQKGTGTARAGSIKSGVFRGGGRIFGPRPRNYDFKLNKKVKQLARKSALAYKAKENAILVVEEITFDAPKTKDFNTILANLNLTFEKVLFVTNGDNSNVHLSAKNIIGAKVVSAENLNTYDILNANKVVISEGSFETINNILN
ncbi:50S ribosomal protein L4 [Putridiphycobacter roseus]|uniref:Large ribosomal subunit protein uL4 n=1 Tax=Putridiphycobacter roseus TaxID=2219161 RepID=A0A2W1NRX1_9FLAO|nr:50S ribosomal protein L4 [Putridiphycobacter roseus]PZE18392.1 50S ribosomal protein L4 [Putridiphycobacter roseus]